MVLSRKEQAKLIIGPRMQMDDVTREQKLTALRIRHNLELWAEKFGLSVADFIDVLYETVHENDN